MEQLNSGTFEYPVITGNLQIDVVNLGGVDVRGPEAIVANRWMLLKDGDNQEMRDTPAALAQEILAGAPWFHRLYCPVRTFPLPNGEAVTLYFRAAGPDAPYQFSTMMGEDVPASAQAVRHWWSDAATLAFADADTAVWLGTQPLPFRQAIIPQHGARLTAADLTADANPLIVVSRYETRQLQEALSPQYEFVQEIAHGEFTVGMYFRSQRAMVDTGVAGGWPGLAVEWVRTWRAGTAGAVVPVALKLTAASPAGAQAVSVRLVSQDGNIAAQQDKIVGPEPRRFLLFVPPDVAPGCYTLQFVLYDTATLEPILDTRGKESVIATQVAIASPALPRAGVCGVSKD
jgi:hypothetical protein